MNYKLLFHEEAVVFWTSLKTSDQGLLLWVLQRIAAGPHRSPDFSESDGHGRMLSGFIEGAFAVIVYVDHAVGEIRVIDLRMADA